MLAGNTRRAIIQETPRMDWTRQRLRAEYNYKAITVVCAQGLDIQKREVVERAGTRVSSDVQTEHTGPGH